MPRLFKNEQDCLPLDMIKREARRHLVRNRHPVSLAVVISNQPESPVKPFRSHVVSELAPSHADEAFYLDTLERVGRCHIIMSSIKSEPEGGRKTRGNASILRLHAKRGAFHCPCKKRGSPGFL